MNCPTCKTGVIKAQVDVELVERKFWGDDGASFESYIEVNSSKSFSSLCCGSCGKTWEEEELIAADEDSREPTWLDVVKHANT